VWQFHLRKLLDDGKTGINMSKDFEIFSFELCVLTAEIKLNAFALNSEENVRISTKAYPSL
jgi:hypothetical protein